MCGINFLKAYPFTSTDLIYLDPPYLRGSRESPNAMYAYEFTDEQHAELLDVVKTLPCMVAISGYLTAFYSDRLRNWRSISFQSAKRNGKMDTEYLWMSYPEPFELHDYSCLGTNFREREQITRQQKRHRAKLAAMTPLRRYALFSVLEELKNQDPVSPD